MKVPLRPVLVLLLVAVVLPLAGCGYKDNLYLPDQKPQHKDSRVQ